MAPPSWESLAEQCSRQRLEFILYLPLGREHFKEDVYQLVENTRDEQKEEAFIAPEKVREETSPESGKKLLVIEDNDEIRHYIHTLFEKKYRVLEAGTVKRACGSPVKRSPDLIISDIMMPVKDGFSCCQEIRQELQTAHIPIIMLTAKAEEEDLLKSTRIGVDDYIMKPFNPEVLKAKAENLIRMREQLKRIYTKTLMLKHTVEKPEEEEQAGLFHAAGNQYRRSQPDEPGFQCQKPGKPVESQPAYLIPEDEAAK